MSTLALNIKMQGKLAVIVGGGAVALRKLRTLHAAGAAVRVAATSVCSEIVAMSGMESLTITTGDYTETVLEGAFLVIAATDNPEINTQVCDDARIRGLLVSVADDPEAGSCTFPALLRRGRLEIAVSTGGRCPTFASDVRDCIAEQVGDEYGTILEQLAAEREKLLTNGSPSTYNARALRSLARDLIAKVAKCKEPLP